MQNFNLSLAMLVLFETPAGYAIFKVSVLSFSSQKTLILLVLKPYILVFIGLASIDRFGNVHLKFVFF